MVIWASKVPLQARLGFGQARGRRDGPLRQTSVSDDETDQIHAIMHNLPEYLHPRAFAMPCTPASLSLILPKPTTTLFPFC